MPGPSFMNIALVKLEGADLGGSNTLGVGTVPGADSTLPASMPDIKGAEVTIVRFFVFSLASTPRRLPSDMELRCLV